MNANTSVPFASTTPLVSSPALFPSLPPPTDAVRQVEGTLEQIDQLWADLDRGEFQIDLSTNATSPANAGAATISSPVGESGNRAKPTHDLRNPQVTVVIPVYNERETILQVIESVRRVPGVTEVIVVDDCSTDGTRGWLETIRDTPGLKLVFQPRNGGKGAALRAGFAAATGEIVIVQDADLEYDPRDIPAVIEPILAGHADIAYGSRYLRQSREGRPAGDGSSVHRFGNWLLTTLSNCTTGLKLTDMETCYKAFRRNVLRELELKQNRFGFEPEITAKIARRRLRVKEVPIQYRPRGYAAGKKIGWRDLLSTLYCIARYGIAD